MLRGAVIIGIIAFWGYYLSNYTYRPLVVMGLFRGNIPSAIVSREDLVVIPNTRHCEDLHQHADSGLIFTACEGENSPRYSWFPPLANFDDPALGAKSQGSIHVIDPKTNKNAVLKFKNFKGAFITHGIDVINDPEYERGTAVYVYAVNHLPSKETPGTARSVIEVFHHVIGETSIEHIRTVWHEALRTPNDILALSTTSLLVTNDHHYREGNMRHLEDLYYGATWTDTIHLEFPLERGAKESAGVKSKVSTSQLHNNNGIGRGRSGTEVIINSAAGGTVYLTTLNSDNTVHVRETIHVDSSLDNPTYFNDPYGSEDGFILAGLSRAADFGTVIRNSDVSIGAVVWKLSPSDQGNWSKQPLFIDNGSLINGATTAILVPIDPKKAPKGSDERQGWLYITSFSSANIIAVKISF